MDNLIENIAYKSTDGNVNSDNFDPNILESKFRQAMLILQVSERTNGCQEENAPFRFV